MNNNEQDDVDIYFYCSAEGAKYNWMNKTETNKTKIINSSTSINSKTFFSLHFNRITRKDKRFRKLEPTKKNYILYEMPFPRNSIRTKRKTLKQKQEKNESNVPSWNVADRTQCTRMWTKIEYCFWEEATNTSSI